MGTPLPKSIADAPLLEDTYQHNILAAFWKLSTCREVGMGTGPIPWVAIDRFATRQGYDIDEIEYETFVYLIMELDSVFLDYVRQESEKESNRGKSRTVRQKNEANRVRRR